MQRLKENHMNINLNKCFFGNIEASCLGFMSTLRGIKPGKGKLKAVETANIPETKEENKSFLELWNFFRAHIKDFARIC
jgi:hypothetical protein